MGSKSDGSLTNTEANAVGLPQCWHHSSSCSAAVCTFLDIFDQE